MKALHIRDISEQTLSALKRLAALHHRSLQGELHYIIERAVEQDKEDMLGEAIQLYTVNSGVQSKWSRNDMYDDSGR